MHYKSILILCVNFVLISCGCKIDGIEPVKPIRSSDKLMDCTALSNEIKLAQYHLQSAAIKKDYAASYAKTPRCLVDSLLKIEMAEVAAKERMGYLNVLKQNKGCGN